MPASSAIAYGTVVDLTDRKIKSVNLQVHGANGVLHRFLSSVLGGFISKLTSRASSRFIDDAIWFRGISQKLWDENIDMRSISSELLPRLEKLKTSVLFVREHALLARAQTTSESLKRSQTQLIESTAELFEAIEEYKWTIIELEANYGYVNVPMAAKSKEELDKAFDAIQ